MPIQKKKIKKPAEKSATKPSVNIKQEPEDLKPLSGYLDDRLELIRQVFSCVKPKEIKYLLPDFLEGKSNDVIKERCLDEVLGISTKRLHSIINNTKCPTDTESDSENSDVQNIKEHISLDEISSDSDVEAKRSGKRIKKAENNKQLQDKDGGAKGEKEMTVLELLELQARARAIRSQLALEPVTKIEIDSEHEEEAGQGDIDTDDETGQPSEKRALVKGSSGAAGLTENGQQPKQEGNSQQKPVRVRLKRNFRIRQVGDGDEDEQDMPGIPSENVREKSSESAVHTSNEKTHLTTEPPQPIGPATAETSTIEEKEKTPEKEEEVEKLSEVENQEANDELADNIEKKDDETVNVVEAPTDAAPTDALGCDERDTDRESSPEVIPVEASPETLCISSDSEEERLAKQRASIFVANIDELDRQAKEQPPPSPELPHEDTEPEEGEISEDEVEVPPPVEETVTAEVHQQDATEKEDTIAPNSTVDPKNTDPNQIEVADENETNVNTQTDGPTTELVEQETSGKSMIAQSSDIHTLSSESDESDPESGDSSSSTSSGEEVTKTEPPKLDNSAQDDEDIVEIHDSGDENLLLDEKPVEEEKSWNTRWLKSNRVAKVMATSRLGNKVREKLKKKKQEQQAEQLELPEAPENAQPSPIIAEPLSAELPANVELGSVEHYRELVAQQENKE